MERIKDYLVYPLIVGIIVAFFSFVLPKLLEKGKKIQYRVEGPIPYLQPERVGNLDIKINGVDTKNLTGYTVLLTNTGGKPVKDLFVRYVFATPESNFKILTDFHETIPKLEFGRIDKVEGDSISVRYKYELMNPDDVAKITILTINKANLIVFAKQEELSFVVAKVDENMGLTDQASLIVAVVGVISSILTSLTKRFLK